MAILRLTMLPHKRDEQARVLVDELMTCRALRELAHELEEEGLRGEALWYRARLKEMVSRNLAVLWERQANCPPTDLSEKLFDSYRRALANGKRIAYACIY